MREGLVEFHERRNRLFAAFVFISVVLAALPQTALVPIIDRDEPHFAEASREMLQRSDWIVPTFNDQPRYNKPPLIYWCQEIAYLVFGETTFAARVPSVLATAGTAALLYWVGANLSRATVGLTAAFSYAFCFQAMQQGRVATADGLLVFFMTLTIFAGWRRLFLARRIYAGNQPPLHYIRAVLWCRLALFVGLSLGFLAKGPEAWLPLIPMLVFAYGKTLRREILGLFALSLIPVAVWAIPAYLKTHGEFWRYGLSEGLGQRAVTSLQGHGASTFLGYVLTLPFYVLLFWISALPASALALCRWKTMFRLPLEPADRNCPRPYSWEWFYTLLNVALIFGIFTLMVTKLPHYTLPAFPLLALMFGLRWTRCSDSPSWNMDHKSPLPLILLGIGLAFALITSLAVPRLLAAGYSPSPVHELVRQVENDLTPMTQFAVVDYEEPSAVWEMRRKVRTFCHTVSPSAAAAYLAEPGPHALILKSETWQQLALPPSPDWTVVHATGLNTGHIWDSHKGAINHVELTLVLKRD